MSDTKTKTDLKELISQHGSLSRVVYVPPSKDHLKGYLMIEFLSGHVELAIDLCLCREHLDKIGAVSGLQPRQVEAVLKHSRAKEFLVWSDPHKPNAE